MPVLLALRTAIIIYACTVAAQSSTLASKRGLAYLGDDHESDQSLLLSENSSIAWYYNWSPNIISTINRPFVPLLHGLDDADPPSGQVRDTLDALPATSTHLLTFNEPDGTTASGGSAIAPSDAARSYIDHIAPLRTAPASEEGGRRWRISHPATTGSPAGLAWLREFNVSCWELDPDGGCPADFVAVHWYGDFGGLAAWLGTLREFYVTNASSSSSSIGGDVDDLAFWVTELALPRQDGDATLAMLNQSLAYLDGLAYVAAYAWYGAARKGEGSGGSWDGYTGDGVAMFNRHGALTDVGALYLGGEEEGFVKGETGAGAAAAAGRVSLAVSTGRVAAVLAVFLGMWNMW